MKKLTLHIFTVIAAITVLSPKVHGQQTLKDSTIIKSIAGDLSVSEIRAGQINAALSHNRSALEKVIKDKTMDQKVRNDLIKKLLEERRSQIDITLSKSEKEQLKNFQTANAGKYRQDFLKRIASYREENSKPGVPEKPVSGKKNANH